MAFKKDKGTIEFYIQSISRYISYGRDKRISCYGITNQQGKVLGIIYGSKIDGDDIHRKDIQEIMGISGPSVSSLLDSLEKKGLIKRSISQSDGRALNVEVTPEGREIVEKIHGFFKESEENLVRGMTDEEKKTLLKLLKKAFQNTDGKFKL